MRARAKKEEKIAMAAKSIMLMNKKRIISLDFYTAWHTFANDIHDDYKKAEPLSIDTLSTLLVNIEDNNIDRECLTNFYYERMMNKLKYSDIIEKCEEKLPLELKLKIFENVAFECLILMYFNMPIYREHIEKIAIAHNDYKCEWKIEILSNFAGVHQQLQCIKWPDFLRPYFYYYQKKYDRGKFTFRQRDGNVQ